MVEIILASHGDYCLGLKQTAEMITGPAENLSALSFRPGEDPEQYQHDLQEMIESRMQKGEVLLLIDLKGGTPYNMAMLTKQKLDFKVIAGANVPMLLSLLTSSPANASEAVEIALNQENWGIELEEMPQVKHRRILK